MSLPPAKDYAEYQSVEELLSLQRVRTGEHDEMTFMTIAQAMELGYKAAHLEAVAMRDHLAMDRVDDAITMGSRVATLIELFTTCWNVYATMTPLAYLGFRDALGKGSGFQSVSYRLLEFALGNRVAALANHHRDIPWAWALIEAEQSRPSLWDETNRLLARRGHPIPAALVERNWAEQYEAHPEVEQAWLGIYRSGEDPQLIRLGERLVDVAMRFSEFRAKHLLIVERTMGWRPGTGGTSGVGWLRTITEHRFFPELWSMRTLL
ncbi:MAG: tryptophan 2,3-dioxygenase [Gemmatimonadales bacterium]